MVGAGGWRVAGVAKWKAERLLHHIGVIARCKLGGGLRPGADLVDGWQHARDVADAAAAGPWRVVAEVVDIREGRPTHPALDAL